jgi:hypothetical protein
MDIVERVIKLCAGFSWYMIWKRGGLRTRWNKTGVPLNWYSMLAPHEYLPTLQVKYCATDMPVGWNMFPVFFTREY